MNWVKIPIHRAVYWEIAPIESGLLKWEGDEMKIRNSYKGLLIVVGITLMSGSVMADGNTIAASSKKQALSFESSGTLLSGLNGEDVCATIVNRSNKTGLIELMLTDDGAGVTSSQIGKNESSALCGMDTDSVTVTCLGPGRCVFTWSVDKF
jgi:hypothetical protein